MNQFEKSRPPKILPMIGMIRSFTSESTILPNAAPMMTPTARSITLPLTANSRNSVANDMVVRPLLHTAASPLSPVRMRTTCSTAVTKILPSPIFPVRAALMIASIARST